MNNLPPPPRSVPSQILPCHMLQPSPPRRTVEGIPRDSIAQVTRQSTVKCSRFEHEGFHIKFLQKYSRFNMNITSCLTVGEGSISVSKEKLVLEYYNFLLLGGPKNIQPCPASDPKDILDSGISCLF